VYSNIIKGVFNDFKNENIEKPFHHISKINCQVNIFTIQCNHHVKEVELKYPLKIDGFYSTDQLKHGEAHQLRVDLKNISHSPYGNKNNEFFEVKYKLSLYNDLHFKNIKETQIETQIPSISDGSSFIIEEDILMGFDSSFFEESVIL
jgi:hypothetical protein